MNFSKAEFEDALCRSWVGSSTELLETYIDVHTNEESYFKWKEGENGAHLVTFKPRVIPFGILNQWLSKPFIKDIWLVRQSSFAASMMGATAAIQEIHIFIQEDVDEDE